MRCYNGQGKLDALTLEVIYAKRNSNFHAPADDGDPICGYGGGTRRRLGSLPPMASPCGHCFSPEVAEQFEDRDGDVVDAVRGE
jgi:hypothetical protein